VPRSHRARKEIAIEATARLMAKYPHSSVAVKDLSPLPESCPISPPMLTRAAFIEPSLPSPADRLPRSPDWVHEIKHDGYRLMARRDFSWTKPARPERDRTPLR
jgi:ATP-dependent DNA ligase